LELAAANGYGTIRAMGPPLLNRNALGGQCSEMPYFRYGILNRLRVALFLTYSRQRVTSVHFFMLALPAGLVGIAISLGGSTSRRFIWVVVAIGLGLVFGWLIPRVLWKLLQEALNRGWFIRNGHVPSEPVMTRLEYSQRYVRWRRAYPCYAGGYIATLLASCVTGLVAADSQWLPECLGNVILYSAAVSAPIFVFLGGRFRRSVAAKYDLVCSTCGASIADREHGVGGHGYIACSNCGRRLALAS
jgi:DNA-directed RNA polymerase subunit RPC12/RpoP